VTHPPATQHRGDLGSEIAGVIAAGLRDIPDFPEPGVLFKDISPLLADASAFARSIEALAGAAAGPVDAVAGIEARGFLIAGALACELNCGLVPVRKAGKLPPPTVRRRYDLEYGAAEIEVPVEVLDGRRVLLVDDVLATGGTLCAAADLVEQAGGTLAGLGVLLELEFLAGRDRLTGRAPLTSLLRV
jgi:adenine phosphoribosyltransferase